MVAMQSLLWLSLTIIIVIILVPDWLSWLHQLFPLAPSSISGRSLDLVTEYHCPRVDALSLSHEQFWSTYASQSSPVVLTNAISLVFGGSSDQHIATRGWSLDDIVSLCGHVEIDLTRYVVGGDIDEWAGLKRRVKMTTMKNYIHRFNRTRRKKGVLSDDRASAGDAILFDWSIPNGCPALLKHASTPNLFGSHDILTTSSLVNASRYKNYWPSLFIQSSGTRSGLHIDGMGTSFWQLLLKGTKVWRMFRREAIPFLHPTIHGQPIDLNNYLMNSENIADNKNNNNNTNEDGDGNNCFEWPTSQPCTRLDHELFRWHQGVSVIGGDARFAVDAFADDTSNWLNYQPLLASAIRQQQQQQHSSATIGYYFIDHATVFNSLCALTHCIVYRIPIVIMIHWLGYPCNVYYNLVI
jgi:hypothetical protein